MDMVALHRDFADEVRKVKPWLPAQSVGGVTFRHAVEFEYGVLGLHEINYRPRG